MDHRPLRVAMISEHASPVALLGGADAGGQNVYVDELSCALASLDLRVDIYTRRDDPRAPEVIEWSPGVRVVNLSAGPPAPLPKDELWPLMPEFRDALLRFMLRDGARYDVLHGNFWMSGWVATRLRETLGVPAVQLFHALGATKQRHQGVADTSPPERVAVETRVVREADAVIAQCPSEQAELSELYGAEPGRIALIPAGVNTERFRLTDKAEARRAIGLNPEELVVVYVGRLLPRKDVRNVVRATALLARETTLTVRLLVVGGESPDADPARTPEIGELRRLAEGLGIADRVTFTGKRQPEELRLYYGAGDVAVTTPWYEPYGLTPLEAMACGRPVVGSAVGGITHTVRDGETGLLVPPRDPAALADRLLLLLSEPELRDRMGRAARERVEREFGWSGVAEETGALYARLIAARSTVAPLDRAALAGGAAAEG